MQAHTPESYPSLLGKLAAKRLPGVRQKITIAKSTRNKFEQYRFDPSGYIRKFLGWQPTPQQQQVIAAYAFALQQMQEKHDYEQGKVALTELKCWQPGTVIQNWIKVESGQGPGKTKVAAGLTSHFFDCFPSIISTFAPSQDQLNDLLWKEIRTDRKNKNLPGRVMDGRCEIKDRANHFVTGKATDNSGGKGIERIQGQHHTHLGFIIDEADGVADFVFDGIEGMAGSVMTIVLMLGNPRSDETRFYQVGTKNYVKSFRLSTLDTPNVIEGREVIPGVHGRDWVDKQIDDYCEVVKEHNLDLFTFEVPWRSGFIYQPSADFCWRVLGIAPNTVTPDTFCPVGRFEAACKRDTSLAEGDRTKARLGVDVARYGDDMGTFYRQWIGTIKRIKQFTKQDYYEYFLAIKEDIRWLVGQGVTDIQVRIDAGGGFGGGVASHLNNDAELNEVDQEGKRKGDFVKLETLQIFEINFDSNPYERDMYYNIITEMYYHAGEALKLLQVVDAPNALQSDLCKRYYRYRKSREGYDVKTLVSKEDFRTKYRRSPDDGDGFVLTAAPDYLFSQGASILWA